MASPMDPCRRSRAGARHRGVLEPIEGITGTYVALGDSYSAGEGLRPFDQFTTSDQASGGTGCHRSSPHAYPRLLRFEAPSPAERFVACSGAVKHDMYNPHRTGDSADSVVIAPQLDGEVHPEVGLVTLSIGGNDVVFSKVVVHCFLHVDCLDSTFRAPRDVPDRDLRFPATQPLRSWAEEALVLVRGKVDDLYPKLRAQFPNARIIVVGYPYLFPDRGAPVFDLSDCQSMLRRFARGERGEVRALHDELNATLYEAAVSAGIEFVSPAAGLGRPRALRNRTGSTPTRSSRSCSSRPPRTRRRRGVPPQRRRPA